MVTISIKMKKKKVMMNRKMYKVKNRKEYKLKNRKKKH